jgi:adenylate/nucleoside-diphosphate kinase
MPPSVARRFADENGMMRLSIGEAIRSLLEMQPHSELAHSIQSHLMKGLTVPDELAVQALEVALMDMRCQTRGLVVCRLII